MQFLAALDALHPREALLNVAARRGRSEFPHHEARQAARLGRALQERRKTLLQHGHAKGNKPLDLSTRAGRIEWNRALLRHDRAAWAHNPSYADAIARETAPSKLP